MYCNEHQGAVEDVSCRGKTKLALLFAEKHKVSKLTAAIMPHLRGHDGFVQRGGCAER